MPTEKYPGVAELFLVSSLSPSQVCTEKTTEALRFRIVSATCPDIPTCHVSNRGRRGNQRRIFAYHPMNLLRVSIAAMGSVDDSVEENSAFSPLARGSW